MTDLDKLISRAESMLGRLEQLMPAVDAPDWDAAFAFRWRRRRTGFGSSPGFGSPAPSMASSMRRAR